MSATTWHKKKDGEFVFLRAVWKTHYEQEKRQIIVIASIFPSRGNEKERN